MQEVQIREGGPTSLADIDRGFHTKGDLHRLGHQCLSGFGPP